MSDELRDRYRKLLRWYPTGYRAERGEEIVETYLDLAKPDQRRPRARDVADLLRGGLRQQLRARDALGLADALPLAAQLALITGAMLAGVWLSVAERITMPVEDIPWHPMLPFASLGAAVWLVWVLVPIAALLGVGRPAVAVALLATAAVIPLDLVLPYGRPTLFVLVPQLALGVIALAVPARRWSPAAGAGIVLTAAALGIAAWSGRYEVYYLALDVTQTAGVLLALVATGTGVLFAVRRDRRAWWPALILLGPVLLLVMTATAMTSPQRWPTWQAGVATTVLVVAAAITAVPATLWLRNRRRPATAEPTDQAPLTKHH